MVLFPKPLLISICILTRNRPKFLKICVNNLLEKLYYLENYEIIIMDNGSTDQTKKLLEEYGQSKKIRILRNKKHIGLNGFKKLFRKAKGEYIIEIDDDVLEFPLYFDRTMVEYINVYTDYGYLALNVVQNEFTNGAKPDDTHYTDDIRKDKIVQQGPAGAWCTCFRRNDYRKVRIPFDLLPLSLRRTQDSVLAGLFNKYLKLKPGIIKTDICFHASGPYYAKQYGYLETEIEKYQDNNLASFVEHYKSFLDK
ncbi:MAG: glycosyltransferase family 2 protein [Bacteroidia bacterium]